MTEMQGIAPQARRSAPPPKKAKPDKKQTSRGGSRKLPVHLYSKSLDELLIYARKYHPKIPLKTFEDGKDDEAKRELLREVLLSMMKDDAQQQTAAARAGKDSADQLQKAIEQSSGPVPTGDVVQAARKINEQTAASASAANAEPAPPVSRPELQDKRWVKDWMVGEQRADSGMVNKDGKALLKDSDPKLPEHLAFADIPGLGPVQQDPNDPRLPGDIRDQLPQGLRSDVKGPMRRPFRHPQNTVAVLNRETSVVFHITETLMREAKYVPLSTVDKDGKPVLPEGAVWGD